jgi:hypothetical protein
MENRKRTLSEIVQNGEVIGFRVDGFFRLNWGDHAIIGGQCGEDILDAHIFSIWAHPAGEMAEGVCQIKSTELSSRTGWDKYSHKRIHEYFSNETVRIISGMEKARQFMYENALSHAKARQYSFENWENIELANLTQKDAYVKATDKKEI